MTETDTSHTPIIPFTLAVSQDRLDGLDRRLESTRFADPLPGAEGGTDDWSTGVPVSYLRLLVDYWRNDYDWRSEESRINEFPQFTTEIDGQAIHFLHVRSSNPDAVPLVLTHGWPGSFVEFLDLIEPLTEPQDHGGQAADAFHLVIPSLPGFGFSSPVTHPGWTTSRVAAAWLELVDRLGYDRFAVQGGDLGSAVSPAIARLAPERVIGVHVNGSLGMPLQHVGEHDRATMTPLELDRVARVEAFMREEFGYIAIQSTRPQTLGAGLTDSPAGQLAWILDKFREWTWPRETAPDQIVGRDRLLTNVMLYWLTGTASSSAWMGYAQQEWGSPQGPSGVPTAAIMFAHDVGIRRFAEREHTVVRWTDVEDRGGHFAALEQPQLLIDDVREFFRELR